MCNSYSVTKVMLKLALRSGRNRPLMDGEGDVKIIRPTLPGWVLRTDEWESMRWGFHRPFANAVNNTRSDKLDSPMWREAYAERRCVIPLSSWFEFSGTTKSKQAHEIRAAAGGLLWAAGPWEEHATLGRCDSMIMTDANDWVSKIHHRMPALLPEDDLEVYLSGVGIHRTPASVELTAEAVPSPLKKPKATEQGELF